MLAICRRQTNEGAEDSKLLMKPDMVPGAQYKGQEVSMITAAQCRAGRALVEISRETLAKLSAIDLCQAKRRIDPRGELKN